VIDDSTAVANVRLHPDRRGLSRRRSLCLDSRELGARPSTLARGWPRRGGAISPLYAGWVPRSVTVPGEPSPTLDCDLTVTIEGPGSGRQVKDLRSVRHAGSYSFGGLQHYNSEPFQLGSRGEYVFRIASRSDAPAMRARGATVTLTQYYHPTEWVLAAGLSRVAGFALIAVGAIGSLWSAILGMRRERQAA